MRLNYVVGRNQCSKEGVTMSVFKFEDRNEPLMRENLKKIGAMDNLSVERRVQMLQQKVAELLTASQKAGIKTEI